MSKKFVIGIVLLFAACITANAEVTVEQSTDPAYMINEGFSEALAEEVFIVKNRVQGQPCEPLYEKNNNKFVSALKKFYNYIDPAQDGDIRYHHDIKMSPSYSDL